MAICGPAVAFREEMAAVGVLGLLAA